MWIRSLLLWDNYSFSGSELHKWETWIVLCHLVYLPLSLKLFCTPYYLIFFHCIVNWFRWWSFQQFCSHMNIYLAMFSWYSYWDFLFLFHLVSSIYSSVHQLIDINPHIYTYLFILIHKNERILTWKAISDCALYVVLCFFVFNFTKMYLKTWEKKGDNKV